MSKNTKCIVTVINSISETSMPYNEFIVYRHTFFSNVKQIVIVCSKTIPPGMHLPEGLEVHWVGINPRKIREIIKNVKADCERKGIEFVIHLHQPKSAIVFYLGTLFAKLNKHTLFTVHNMFDAYDFKYKILSILCVLMAGGVTCVSEAAYHRYPGLVKKIKRNKMVSLQNGVDLKRIDRILEQTDKMEQKKTKELIYVARMVPVKNHRFLIDLLPELDDCKLVLIGAEDKDGEIRRMVKERNLENRVEMTGLIPRNEVFRRLQNADIYVSPSLVEGLPVSVLEAMYVGLPVVLSDIYPHLEVGAHSESAVTLQLDKKMWIKQLNRYLRADKTELAEIGTACKKCAKEHFSLESMLDKYDGVYNKLVKRGIDIAGVN